MRRYLLLIDIKNSCRRLRVFIKKKIGLDTLIESHNGKKRIIPLPTLIIKYAEKCLKR